MADYPNVDFETFSPYQAQRGDDVSATKFESFITPVALGFKTCRLLGSAKFWVNKVWDPGGGGNWVLWETEEGADTQGQEYPDPYGSGFGVCSGFRTAGFQRYR